MMTLILVGLGGVVLGAIGMVSAYRRAAKKPQGRTAKIVKLLVGETDE
jgi:hypothetical protein